MRSSCPGCADKDLSFAFSEFVICCVHPVSLRRGVARDRHDTRGGEAMAAEVPQRGETCADERQLADVKSQRPGTPMLVSALMRKHHAPWWPTSPAHQGDCV